MPPLAGSSDAEPTLSEEYFDRRAGMALAAQIKGLPVAKQLELMRANPRGRAWLRRSNQGQCHGQGKQRTGSRPRLGVDANAEVVERLRKLKGEMSVMAPTPTFAGGAHSNMLPSASGWDDSSLRRVEGDPAFRYDTFYGTAKAINWKEPASLPPPQAHSPRSPRSMFHTISSAPSRGPAVFLPRATSPLSSLRSPRPAAWSSPRSRPRSHSPRRSVGHCRGPTCRPGNGDE